jgi:hypothetical protein
MKQAVVVIGPGQIGQAIARRVGIGNTSSWRMCVDKMRKWPLT